LGVPALSDQLAAVAVTMGERLDTDDAGCSTQIAGCARLRTVVTRRYVRTVVTRRYVRTRIGHFCALL